MSIFSRVSTELTAVKKLASIPHLGNGISIDAAESLISKQLAAATGSITGAVAGATSSITGAVAGATKIAGSVTSAASKISGAGLTSGVLPGPIKR